MPKGKGHLKVDMVTFPEVLVSLREARQSPRVEEESRDLERAKLRRVSTKLRTWASQDAPGIGHVSSKFKPCWRRGRHE